MKIASWNVNSVKARLDYVKDWLEREQPDVLMIQELKGLEFPHDDFKAIGYESEAVTQKAYNGVAVLSRHPIKPEISSLPGSTDSDDDQARYLETTINGLRLINIYLPNGNPVDTEKFSYKLTWMERLKKRLAELRTNDVAFAVGGDFNIIPDNKDCYNPQEWKNDALFHIESRRKFRAILNLGLSDAFRVHNHRAGQYTFWDYQGGAWQKDQGIRIDHFLLSPSVTDRLLSCTIDKEPRGLEKPSDHTPVILETAAPF